MVRVLVQRSRAAFIHTPEGKQRRLILNLPAVG
jgi:hypothetical protein